MQVNKKRRVAKFSVEKTCGLFILKGPRTQIVQLKKIFYNAERFLVSSFVSRDSIYMFKPYISFCNIHQYPVGTAPRRT